MVLRCLIARKRACSLNVGDFFFPFIFSFLFFPPFLFFCIKSVSILKERVPPNFCHKVSGQEVKNGGGRERGKEGGKARLDRRVTR